MLFLFYSIKSKLQIPPQEEKLRLESSLATFMYLT